MPARPGNGKLVLLARAYLLGVAAFVAWVVFASLRDHYTVPFMDDWRIWGGYFSTPFWRWVWEGSNGHRLLATFPLMALDYEYFGGRMHVPAIASVVCAVATVPLLYIGVRSCRELPPPLRSALFGFSGFALFWAGRCFNLHWGTNQGSVLAILWLTVSLVCVARYADLRAAGGAPGAWLGVAAGIAAFLATFAQGMGFAAWASLLAVALVARLPWRAFAGFAVAAVLSVALYMSDLRVQDGVSLETARSIAVLQPLEILGFSAAFIGAPLGWIANGLGLLKEESIYAASAVAGAVGIAFAAIYGFRLLRPRSRAATPADCLAVGLLVFPLVGSVAAGLTRITMFTSEQAVEMRFVCWSALFWTGGAFALAARSARGGGWPRLAAALPALSLVMLAALVPAEELHAGRRDRLTGVALTLLMGQRYEAMWRSVTRVDPDRVARVARRFERDRRSFYGDPRLGVAGTRLLERFESARPARCRGSLRAVWGSPVPGVARVEGWVGDTAKGRAPRSVLIADAAGIVRGLGEVVGRSVKPLGDEAAPAAHGVFWIGYVTDYRQGGPHTAWGLLDEGRVCPFARG